MKTLTTWMSTVLLAAAAGVTLAQQPASPPAPSAPRAPAAPPASAAAPAAPAAPAALAAPNQDEMEKQLDAARDRLDNAAREVAELSNRLGERIGDHFVWRDMRAPRAVLGVQIDSKTGAGGAAVVAVSPGGAADQAGLKAGDIIVAIDGEDLSKRASPGRALVEEVRDLGPEQKVKLRVLTAGKTREVELTPRSAPRSMLARGEFTRPIPAPGPGFPPRPPGAGLGAGPGDWRVGPMGEGPFAVELERGNFARMELASLSPRLGSYFGAKEGVLVVRSGNSAFQLEDGDVITAIDGREPTSAAHATRILRSYQRGEKISIKVLRDRKPKVLEVTIAGG